MLKPYKGESKVHTYGNRMHKFKYILLDIFEYVMLGHYYKCIDYSKTLTKINGNKIVSRTITIIFWMNKKKETNLLSCY